MDVSIRCRLLQLQIAGMERLCQAKDTLVEVKEMERQQLEDEIAHIKLQYPTEVSVHHSCS